VLLHQHLYLSFAFVYTVLEVHSCNRAVFGTTILTLCRSGFDFGGLVSTIRSE